MTKEPATALPWTLTEQPGYIAAQGNAQNSFTTARSSASKRNRADMAYVVHSANAYPLLVAMLRRAALDENYEADDCVALLRELGELV